MRKNYQKVKTLYLGVFMLFISSYAFAQSPVSGKVTDATSGESLVGVNVLVKGTSTGTLTDLDGNYSVQISGDASLLFSYVGYKPMEVAIGSRTVIDVSLIEDATSLE
jgi:hypothetical protein